MSKPKLIFSFANNQQDPLPSLETEKAEVLHIVQDRKKIKDDFEFVNPVTRQELADFLKEGTNRDALTSFYYSGHAAGDRLITEGEGSNAEGLANLLSQCRNLTLVILNGCSTEGQVKKLFDAFAKTGNKPPVIIATSASVGDKVATEFGVSIIEQLFTYGMGIQNAFNLAFSRIQTNIEAQNLKADIREVRSLGMDSEEGTWGLYLQDGAEFEKSKTITINQICDTNKEVPYIPNSRLFRGFISGLSVINKNIQATFEGNRKIVTDLGLYKRDIYASFPYPISKRLQRLESSESTNDVKENYNIFYNKVDRHRLGELVRTAQSILDLSFALVQAELYQIINTNPGSISKENIQKVLNIYSERKDNSTIKPFNQFLEIIIESGQALFVSELALLIDLKKIEIYNSGIFFEKLIQTYTTLSDIEAEGLVEITENKLSIFFNYFLFFAKYKITSVENIFLNHRRKSSPSYEHQIIRQQWSDRMPSIESQKMETFLDNSSIIIQKENDPNIGNFLNLSPFLIDDLKFQEKATISNLLAFVSSKNDNDEFVYRYLVNSVGGSEKKQLMFNENMAGSIAVDFENKGYYEIKDEWDFYINKIKTLSE